MDVIEPFRFLHYGIDRTVPISRIFFGTNRTVPPLYLLIRPLPVKSDWLQRKIFSRHIIWASQMWPEVGVSKVKGVYSSISSKENSWNRNSSIYFKMKKTERFYLFQMKKWKGSIYSNKITGIVLFDPVKRVEQFYYCLNNNWNSSISSTRLKLDLFYWFRSTLFETVLLEPRLYFCIFLEPLFICMFSINAY